MNDFRRGMKNSIPIALGYFAVSMAYGMAAIVQGLSVTEAITISITNLTSAGQFAGTTLIAAGASVAEIILTEITINARYFLMSLSLSQKLREGTSTVRRAVMAYGITDEIYAAAIGQRGSISFSYYIGLMIWPIIGWTSGTAAGSLASSILPADLVSALGIAMYSMFIAIFVPAARDFKPVMICVLMAVALSCLMAAVPVFSGLSSGYSVVMITLLVSGFCAWRYPVKEESEDESVTDREEE